MRRPDRENGEREASEGGNAINLIDDPENAWAQTSLSEDSAGKITVGIERRLAKQKGPNFETNGGISTGSRLGGEM
jgi:hypothetical protein